MPAKDRPLDPNNPDDIGNSEILLKAVRDYERGIEEGKKAKDYEIKILLELTSKIDYSVQLPLTKVQVDEFIERTKSEYSKKFIEPIINLGNNKRVEYLPPTPDSVWYVIGFRWAKREPGMDQVFIQNKLLGDLTMGLPHCFGMISRAEDINPDEMIPWGFGFLSAIEEALSGMMSMCCYLCDKAGCARPVFWKGNSKQTEVVEVSL